MRSIGKRNIYLVKELTRKHIKLANGLGHPDYSGVRDSVRDELPVELWDTWEMADSEIDRIIDDTINESA